MASRIALLILLRMMFSVDSEASPHSLDLQPVDVVLSSSSSLESLGGDSEESLQLPQRLAAFYSSVGTNYETSANVVQISSYRACDHSVRDRTLFGHVVVVFVDEVQPFLAGCVALDNQARFVEKSGGLALIVGSSTRLSKKIGHKSVPSKIPVVILDDMSTRRLRASLVSATHAGAVVNAAIQFVGVEEAIQAADATLRTAVFRPTLLNVFLLLLLALLVSLFSLVLAVKLRCAPSAHREWWMRARALAAINSMETRKFTKPTRISSIASSKGAACSLNKNGSKFGFLPRFASLSSVTTSAAASSTQERCCICLTEFVENDQLRVLLCAHEFHSGCVDPWLLSRRRCPLCQFDVVAKRWPQDESSKKNIPTPPNSREERESRRPLLTWMQSPPASSPSRVIVEMAPDSIPRRLQPTMLSSENFHSSERPLSGAQSIPKTHLRRSRSSSRRRPRRDRQQLHHPTPATLGPLATVSGYSSDVSSHPGGLVQV